jgi:hypothetical protein
MNNLIPERFIEQIDKEKYEDICRYILKLQKSNYELYWFELTDECSGVCIPIYYDSNSFPYFFKEIMVDMWVNNREIDTHVSIEYGAMYIKLEDKLFFRFEFEKKKVK